MVANTGEEGVVAIRSKQNEVPEVKNFKELLLKHFSAVACRPNTHGSHIISRGAFM